MLGLKQVRKEGSWRKREASSFDLLLGTGQLKKIYKDDISVEFYCMVDLIRKQWC